MEGLASAPDPFVMDDTLLGSGSNYVPIYRKTDGLAYRSQAINPAQKTLVLISNGQSQAINVSPNAYVPTNGAAVDNFNIYDGASYSIAGALLGTQIAASPYGPGHVGPHIADKFITGGIFNRVIIVPMAIGATTIAQHATGPLAGRIGVVMRRLASRGITPATPGATFGYLWMQGEADNGSTTQAAYAAGLATLLANANAAGFSGRMFVCRETWVNGAVWAAVQAAQVAFVNGSTVFSGGDLDSLGAGSRNTDNLHFSDAGMASAATLIFNAMHASGAPY